MVEAVRSGNTEASGRLIEFGGAEYMIRGRGYARSIQDVGDIVLSRTEDGTPISIRDVGQVTMGPDLRRGIADLDGKGEVVSGIVIMRQGQNALDVIKRVKERIREIGPGIPAGVKVIPIYDRSELISRSISMLRSTLIEVALTVALVILLFLWHFPSAVIPIATIPVVVFLSFIPFLATGMTANIMSLAGIAIAIGALVDAAIVVVEQTTSDLRSGIGAGAQGTITGHNRGNQRSRRTELLDATGDRSRLSAGAHAGGSGRTALQTSGVHQDFLHGDRGHARDHTRSGAPRDCNPRSTFNFRPAWLSGLLNSTLGGRIHREEAHPLTGRLIRWYQPVVRWSLRWKWAVIASSIALILFSVPVWLALGSEFMPPLDEGALLYMPTTMPGISVRRHRCYYRQQIGNQALS